MLKLKFQEKLQNICAKKPKITKLKKQVRHPFQVINISPYPFWIGFSLFWLVLWFGIFYLNADWANTALKGTWFDFSSQIKRMNIPMHTRFDNVYELYLAQSYSVWDIYCELFLNTWWFDTFCRIKTVPLIFGFQNIIVHSSLLLEVVYPFFYWFLDGIIDSIFIAYINFTWIMQTNIFDDIYLLIRDGEISFWSLSKLAVPLFFILRLGCPFKFLSIGITAKILTTIVWLLIGIGIMMCTGLSYICSFFPLNCFIIPMLTIPTAALISISAEVFIFYLFIINYLIFPTALSILILSSWRWASDISIEGARGEHTRAVQKNLIWGAYLFMLTEVIIFITLFQTTGYFLLNPSVEVCQIWEFAGIHAPYSIGLGFANLILLLNSGWILQIAKRKLLAFSDYLDYKRGGEKKLSIFYILFEILINCSKLLYLTFLTNFFKKIQEKFTFNYRMKKLLKIKKIERGSISKEDRILLARLISNCSNCLLKTIILGSIFMIFQYIEYSNLTFSISSGIYGTCFYCLTGLHGFHVIVGIGLLSICYYQFKNQIFVLDESIFFWFSVRYWQFVDAVWVAVWLLFYARWDMFEILVKAIFNI